MMKKQVIILIALVLPVVAAKAQQAYDKVHYGKRIEAQRALTLDQLMKAVQKNDKALPMEAKVTGQVQAVCQKKGCWMKMDPPNAKPMRITFKDYGFFVPKDLAGRSVVMQGRLYHDTVSVKARRHFARDEGKSEEAIKNITEPTTRLAFKATGVKILQMDDEK